MLEDANDLFFSVACSLARSETTLLAALYPVVSLRLVQFSKDRAGAFRQVINAYGGGENIRIQELAAHSHARIGLMVRFTRCYEQAILEYKSAIALLPQLDRNQRARTQYEAAIETISSNLGEAD